MRIKLTEYFTSVTQYNRRGVRVSDWSTLEDIIADREVRELLFKNPILLVNNISEIIKYSSN